MLEPFDCVTLFLEERSCSSPVNEGVFRNAASRHFGHPFQRACLLRFGVEALKRLPDHNVGRDPRATKDFYQTSDFSRELPPFGHGKELKQSFMYDRYRFLL